MWYNTIALIPVGTSGVMLKSLIDCKLKILKVFMLLSLCECEFVWMYVCVCMLMRVHVRALATQNPAVENFFLFNRFYILINNYVILSRVIEMNT